MARGLYLDLVMAPSCNSRQWYARRDGTVRGPFTDEYIARYVLLGRIRLRDEISQDRIRWRLVRDFPDLYPEELERQANRGDYQRLVEARSKVDERVGDRRDRRGRTRHPSSDERRELPDRRRLGGEPEFLIYHLPGEIPCQAHGTNKRRDRSLRTFLLATILATLVFAIFSVSTR